MKSLSTAAGDDRPPGGRPGMAADPALYDTTFWFCYLANCSLMTGVSLLFRYADFVKHLGGSEIDLGLIVGVGMVGALATRVLQGVGIDRLGARRMWQLSLGLFALSALAHVGLSRVDGFGVYLARILLTTSTAGAFGSSLTFVSLRAPQARMGETIGMIGTSGFFGIALGPALGDFLLAGPAFRQPITRLFVASAALSLLALLFVSLTAKPRRRLRRRHVPVSAVVRRYHPGVILLIAVATGLVLGLPNTFLNAYAIELGIVRIKVFFLVYAAAALIVRVKTRHLSDRWGVRPAILWGLGSAMVSMILYLGVRGEWSLAIPAVFAGAAHALLFPAVLAGGNVSFPLRYRGVSTTLTLAMFDVGNLVGQPAMGGIVELARRTNLPPYPTLFVTVSVVLLVVGGLYAGVSRGPSAPLNERPTRRRRNLPSDSPAADTLPRPPRTAAPHTPSFEACPRDPRS